MPHNLRDPIEPDVPAVILSQATEVERYILERSSVADQMRERMVLCLEALERAAAAADNRLGAVERAADSHDKSIRTINRRWRALVGVFIFIGPIVLIVLERLAARWWP